MKIQIKDQDIVKVLDFLHIKSHRIRLWIAVIETFFERISENHIFLISAGIAFNILLYLIPLILVALYFVNIWVGVDKVLLFFINALGNILPPNYSTTTLLNSTVKEVVYIFSKSSLLGWIGIVSLVWLSSVLFSSIRTGLNLAFKIHTPKAFLFYKIKDILLTIVLSVLVLISTYMFPLVTIVQNLLMSNLPANTQGYFSRFSITVISLSSSFIMFFLLFRFVPNKKLPRKTLFTSIILSVILVELSRNAFGWYIATVANYGKFYGAYAIVASMAIWVYYLIFIVLLSAEIAQFRYDILSRKYD